MSHLTHRTDLPTFLDHIFHGKFQGLLNMGVKVGRQPIIPFKAKMDMFVKPGIPQRFDLLLPGGNQVSKSTLPPPMVSASSFNVWLIRVVARKGR